MENNKLIVDITGLRRYHENLKNNVLTTKQDVISDLETIRTGAAAGANASADAQAKANAAQAAAIEAAATDATNKANAAQAAAEATAAADATSKANAAQAAAEATAAADATSKANAAESAAKTYADGLVKDEEGNVKFDAVGSAAAAQAAAEATAAADATSKADAAQAAAEQKATDLNTAMDERVLKLEAIDHDALAANAAASAVATVLDGAPESFDTLKEVAAWIANNDHASDVAALVTDVANLKAIDHEAYKGADETVLQNAKDYADNNFVKAEGYVSYTQDEKNKLAGVEEGAQVNVIETLEVNGVVATIEDKKATVTVDCYTKDEVDAAIADFATKSTTLSGYGIVDAYTKDELDTIIGENERVTAESLTDLDTRVKDLKDTTYNKTEIDTMIGNVIVIASDEDIDNLFV